MARNRLYRGGVLVAEDFPIGDVARYVRDPDATLWLDLYRPDAAEFAMVGTLSDCTSRRRALRGGAATR